MSFRPNLMVTEGNLYFCCDEDTPLDVTDLAAGGGTLGVLDADSLLRSCACRVGPRVLGWTETL